MFILILVLLMIIASSNIVTYLLKNEIESKLNSLIFSISLLPGIPLIWLMSRSTSSVFNNFLNFYFPLIVSIIIILALLFNIIRFNRK